MKAIIWIIVLALIAWGVWALIGGSDTPADLENAGAAAGAVDVELEAEGDTSSVDEDEEAEDSIEIESENKAS